MKSIRIVLALAVLGCLAAASFADTPSAFSPDGGRYYGPLVDGRFHGKGRIEWSNGARYEGEFREGVYWGKGRLEDGNGDVYEGHFEEGEIVSGTYSRGDGGRYEGGFEDWKFHGAGRLTAHGRTYEGYFVDGVLEGRAKVTGEGNTYEGEVKQWLFHGHGVLRHANGDVYEGNFEYGRYSGEGTLTYGEPRDGRTQVAGTWRYGELVDREAEQKRLAAVETALYQQSTLLDKALSGLEPGRPGQIDMYLLTVAGDGSQEVFRREVEFVQNEFAARFGTAGRAVSLVNSRSTLASVPMATITSIGAALEAIAARMDKDEDILFLFLTSHGSQDHELTLNGAAMPLRGLPAPELGRLLAASGIRWKVVVVSACYSGGFIDALKDERTLVITAARRDRRSFGCADENDFTYFGRAFFKEALPEAQSFQQAFRKAASLVDEWERKDKSQSHSLPQIHSPKAIRAHLERWWLQQR